MSYASLGPLLRRFNNSFKAGAGLTFFLFATRWPSPMLWHPSTSNPAWPSLPFVHCRFRLIGHCLGFNRSLLGILSHSQVPCGKSFSSLAFSWTTHWKQQQQRQQPWTSVDWEKWSGTRSLPKPAKLTLLNSNGTGVRKMQQRVEVPGKEIVNSKTVISEGKLFASLLKHGSWWKITQKKVWSKWI